METMGMFIVLSKSALIKTNFYLDNSKGYW